MIPYQQRGQPISPSAFNELVDMVKSAQITSIVGGTFQRSIGGTSINILSGPVGSSGGSSGSSIPCPFQCSDASTDNTLKVQIAWGLIYQMLPSGMIPDNDPPLKLTVTDSCYIYSKITFNTDSLQVTGVEFSVETEIKSNTDAIQYNLIAVVIVDSTGQSPVISSLQNICQQPYPNPCSLAPSS